MLEEQKENLCWCRALDFRLPTHDLGSLNSFHFFVPSGSRNQLPYGADLIRGVSWDADVVVALEDQLDIADVELGRLAEFGKLASVGENGIDEVVSKLKDCLGDY
jgi:hypothetical protein